MENSQKEQNNSLGCGLRFKRRSGETIIVDNDCDFICGVPDGWGTEYLCKSCDRKLRRKWDEEDRNNIKLQIQLNGGEK